jgi:acetoacetyl-CoA synthetase
VTGKLAEVAADLPTVRQVVVVPDSTDGPSGPLPDGAITLDDFLAPHTAVPVAFEPLPFDHPLYILYSSGTTGAPKCIVHRAGGLLLKHHVEYRLHCDVRPDDRVCYFTTAGWMMWNWLAAGLAAEAALVLYDGSPFHPGAEQLFDLVDATGTTLLGVSAKFIDAVAKSGLRPVESHDLSTLRTVCSTGSPLSPEGFSHVYADWKADLHLASISGGTDLCGCLVGGDPTLPVHAGQIQGPVLGQAMDVFDEEGSPAPIGQQGELVCTAPFPSMPLGFWNDPDGDRYRSAYFERFDGAWHQGDFAERTPEGGFIIHGRSDATLNPGGVRIGTAEVYRQVDRLDEVVESLVIGQSWEGDTRIVLFVVPASGVELDDDLVGRIRSAIRTGASPRHVPAVVLAVPDLPRTRSGKMVEMAVRNVVEGRPVTNLEALANPEALEAFRSRPELA